jgi:coproporphyrinogen III oxidase
MYCCVRPPPSTPNRDADKILAFSTDAVNHVVEAYCPIIKKHMNDPFTQEQKDWQQIRRGR